MVSLSDLGKLRMSKRKQNLQDFVSNLAFFQERFRGEGGI